MIPPLSRFGKGTVLLASTLFCIGRILALSQGHGFANAMYWSCVVGISLFLCLAFFDKTVWTRVTDDVFKGGQDDLFFLGFAAISAAFAALFSEIAPGIIARLPGQGLLPFALLRQQLEDFETYRQVRRSQVLIEIRETLFNIAHLSAQARQEFKVLWLSSNAHEDIGAALTEALERHEDLLGSELTDVRVLCRDNTRNRRMVRRLEARTAVKGAFCKTSGNFRVLIIGPIAFLGVWIGRSGEDRMPDYVVRIDEPVRVAILGSIFDQMWSNSEP